jgi:hypothetical protein
VSTRCKSPAIGRVLRRIQVTDSGCWIFQGSLSNRGYGQIGDGTRIRSAHVVAYESAHGPVPDGQQVDHTCHNRDPHCPGGFSCQHRACVNPEHLEATTSLENHRRRYAKPTNCTDSDCLTCHPIDGPAVPLAEALAGHHVRTAAGS